MVIYGDNISQDHSYSISFKKFPERSNANFSKKDLQILTGRNMIEKSENLDIWGFDLPLTPPSSPCRMVDLNEDTTDFCYRLQPVCTASDICMEDTALPSYRKSEPIVIKDCMWGAHVVSNKRREFSFTRLSLGELPSTKHTTSDAQDVSSKLLGVDPAEVFPSLDDRLVLRDFSSSESDDDTDIDVVTVDPKLLRQTSEDIFPKSPEIITPPKSPDSLPDTSVTCFTDNNYGQRMECNETSTQAQNHNNNTSNHKSTKQSKEYAIPENFSRASHNVLERKRRNELKSKFYGLRDSVPELSGNKKVPKVVILKKAIDYIETIQNEEGMLKTEVQRQKKLHQDLRKRLLNVLRSQNSS